VAGSGGEGVEPLLDQAGQHQCRHQANQRQLQSGGGVAGKSRLVLLSSVTASADVGVVLLENSAVALPAFLVFLKSATADHAGVVTNCLGYLPAEGGLLSALLDKLVGFRLVGRVLVEERVTALAITLGVAHMALDDCVS